MAFPTRKKHSHLPCIVLKLKMSLLGTYCYYYYCYYY